MRLRFWWLGFLLGIFTPLFLGIFFHFANFVFADTTSTSITVNATVSAGPAPVCGNGIVESGEVCDDGNTTSGDGCSATCQLESVCGNGAVESGEQCDDGNTSGQDGCSATCLREAILGSSGNGPEISGVVASATQTTAVVTFQVSSPSAPISSCVLDYGLTRNYTAEVLGAVRIGNIYESGLLADLSPSTDYFYRITCTDTAPNSGVYFGVFRTGESDTTPPIVTNVIANTTISTSEINWTATDNVAVIQCTFVLNTYNRNNPQLLVPITLPVTLLSNNQYRVNANGLYTHETYSFRITCVDDLPNATVVNGSFTTQTDQTPPPDVARFTAAGQDSRNVLEWVYPTIQDSAFFMIRRSTSGFPLSVLDGTLVTSTIYYNRNFLDEGLENGTTYYYTIFVFDTSGNHSNGVSASATPRPAGDRDGDGVNDDMDACDGNRTGQIDTPSGTVVGANGCPFVAINVRNLTIYPVLLYSRTARDQFNRPMGAVSFSGRSQIGGGLQPGVWFLDSPSYGVEFSVESNGHITWPPSLDAIYSAVYGSSGSVIQVLGIPLTIDTSRLDPRNQLRLYSPNLGTNFLPDRASVRLLPGQNYYFSHPYFATFLLSSSGLVSPLSGWEDTIQFANGTITVTPVDICISPDTFVGSYRLATMYGITAFFNQSSIYHILPSTQPISSAFINRMRLISQTTNQQSFFELLRNPLRLSDPLDNETGSLINLTLNLQNIQANVGQCGAVVSRVCGNGRLELTEQCDDGNTRNGDGCSMQCNIEIPQPCGNSRLDPNEQCDDGNTRNGDGCSMVCLREVAVCGNSSIEGNEQCDDGNTRNGDGCSAVCQVEIPICGNNRVEVGEQCDDGNTRNGDGCSVVCLQEPVILTQCSDNIDNDSDGFIDMADAGCSDPTDNSESQTPSVPVEPVSSSGPQPQFWIAQGTIQTELRDGFVTSLSGDQLTVFVPNTLVSSFATSLDFVLFGTTYHFTRDISRSGYRVDVVMPPPGQYQALIIQNGLAQTLGILSFGVRSEPYGVVREAITNRLIEQGILQVSDGSGNNIWNASRYSQVNPVYLGLGGNFGFVVPNNQYDISVSSPGFANYEDSFSVSNHVLNPTITLLPSVRDILSMLIDDLLSGNFGDFLIRARQLLEAIGRAIRGALRDIGKVINDPRVQAANEQIVVPSVAAVSTIALLPSLSNIFLPLLRYMFFQPLLLFGKKKRRGWGTVYNSLNKLPVDLAMVRLIDTVNKKVIQSRVTDLNGRYIFFADRGGYEIEVSKAGYRFPTTFLGSAKEDGRFTDLYHGEHIPIQDEGAPVTPNVPVDPVETSKPPRRIIWDQRARVMQNFLSLSGVILTTISAIISPTIIVFGFLAGHVALYVLFAKFIRPPVPKQWGTVYDAKTNKPIEKAIVRLFTKEYNKLISTQVTGSKGRYAFLAGPSAYYLSIQAPGHTEFLTAPIVPKNVDRAFINQDVYVEKPGFDS